MNARDELADLIEDGIDDAIYNAADAPPSLTGIVAQHAADAVLAAGYRKPEIVGYVVVDVVTKAIDWDGELHVSQEAAIAGLTGPRQMYCKTEDEETDEKTYWARDYMICPVAMPEATK